MRTTRRRRTEERLPRWRSQEGGEARRPAKGADKLGRRACQMTSSAIRWISGLIQGFTLAAALIAVIPDRGSGQEIGGENTLLPDVPGLSVSDPLPFLSAKGKEPGRLATCSATGGTVPTVTLTPTASGVIVSWTGGVLGTDCDRWEVWRAPGVTTDANELDRQVSSNATSGVKDTNAFAGNAYSYEVSASDGTNYGVANTMVSIDPFMVITATASGGGVNLSWTSIRNATAYKLEEKAAGGSWTSVSNAITTTSYSDATGTVGTAYQYRVRAVVSSTDKSWSNESTAVTFPSTACTGTAATLNTPLPSLTGINLSWTKATIGTCTSWEIFRKEGSGMSSKIHTITDTTVVSWLDNGAQAGKTYIYQVALTGGAAKSNETTLDPYTTITATTTDRSGKIDVAWVSSGASYELQRKEETQADSDFARVVANHRSTSYADESGTVGTKYQYRVKPTGKAWSHISAPAVAFPVKPCTVPRITSLERIQTGGVELEWTGDWGSECNQWEILRAVGTGAATSLTTESSEATKSYNDLTATTAGEKYTYTVKAKHTTNSAVEQTSLTGPIYIIDLTATPKSGDPNTFDLSWSEVTGASGYSVERKTGSGAFAEITALGSVITYTDTNLGVETHTYRVKVVGTTPESYSNEVAVTVSQQRPDPPRLRGRLESDRESEPRLEWTPPSDTTDKPVASYTLQYSTSSNFSSPTTKTMAGTANTARTTWRYYVESLTACTQYYFRVRSVNGTGDGAFSNVITLTTWNTGNANTCTGTKPGTMDVTGTVSKLPPDPEITLSWPAVNSATGYIVEARNCDDDGWQAEGNTTSMLSYTDRDLHCLSSSGGTAKYRVAALNGVGYGPWDTESVAVPADNSEVPDAPGKPTTALAMNGRTVTVEWTAPASDGGSTIQGYTIERTIGSREPTEIPLGASPLIYLDMDLATGGEYKYRVLASNGRGQGGWSPYSDPRSVDPPDDTTKVRNLTATDDRVGEVVLTWTRPSGAQKIKHYLVQLWVAGSGDDPWRPLETVDDGTTHTDTTINEGITRRYRVIAVDTDDTEGTPSEISGTATSSTPVSRPAPTNVRGTVAADTSSITVTWTAPAGTTPTGYHVRLKGASSNLGTLNATTRTYTHTGVTRGSSYEYEVRATYSGGNSAWVASSAVRVPSRVIPRPPPTNVRGTLAADTGSIRITWSAPSGAAPTGYNVRLKDAGSILANTDAEARAYKHSDISRGKSYEYEVRANYSNGNSIWVVSPVVKVPDRLTTKPGIPLDLSATAAGTTVTLSWNAPANDGGTAITGYKIEFNEGDGWTTLVANSSSTDRTYLHTDLDPGTRLRYRVSAINAEGTGSASAVAEAVVSAVVPSPPIGVTATAIDESSITVNWLPPVGDGGSPITSYKVDVSEDGTTWQVLDAAISPQTQSYLHSDLDPATSYSYRVLARNKIGWGDPSKVASTETDADYPDPPVGLTAKTAGTDRIDLRWRAPEYTGGVPIIGYDIEVSTDLASWEPLVDLIETVFYQHTGLDAKTIYHYRVFAVNKVGHSGSSNIANSVTDADVPGQPTDLSAHAQSQSTISLEWHTPLTDGGSLITGYKIERSDDGGGTWSTIRPNTGTREILYIDRELEVGTLYRYRVSAVNGIGVGPASEYAEARTHGPPSAPHSLVASAISTTQINLWWNPPDNDGGRSVTGYVLYSSDDGGGSWNVIGNLTDERTFSHRDLKPGRRYQYRVRAVNAVGAGPYSSISEATTKADVPDAPYDLSARPMSTSRIDIRWRAPENDGGSPVTGYFIEMSINSGATWTVIADAHVDAQYTHVELVSNTLYRYRVSAINAVGTGDPSGFAEARTPANVPSYPPNLMADAVSHDQIDLRWIKPEEDGGVPVTGYRIDLSEDVGNSWFPLVENTTNIKNTYSHQGLVHARTYMYRVAAINEIGRSSWSPEASAMTAALPPGQPRDLVATAVSHDQIDLTWREPEDDGGSSVQFYIVEISRDDREWTGLDETGSKPSYSHIRPEPGLTWSYRVSAVNKAGTGEPSNIASAMVDDPVQRTIRVSEAILPWFAAAATGSATRAISDRIEAMERGDLSNARVNFQNGRNGLRGLADGASVSQPGVAGSLAVWSTADLTSIGRSEMVDFDGQVFSVHAGLDGLLRRDLLVGISANRSSGEFDFTDRSHGRNISGEYAANVTSMGPYVAWIHDDAMLWAASGFGRGSIAITDSLVSERTSQSSTSMLAVGGRKQLSKTRIGAFGLKAEGWTSELDVASNLPSHLEADVYDPGYIEEAVYTTRRARFLVDWSVFNHIYGNSRTEMVLQAGGRTDWTSLDTGVSGTEIGGRLGFQSQLFRVHGSGRMFMHSEYREWGIRGMIELRSRDSAGLSLRLNPSYGMTSSGIQGLWHNGATRSSAGSVHRKGHLEVDAGYQPPGLPFMSFGRYDMRTNRVTLGTRIRSTIEWHIESHYNTNGPGVLIRGQWNPQGGGK